MFRDSEANAPIHPLHDVNALEKRTQINEFAWGGALGAAATVSLFSLYSFFSAVYSLNGFKDEMNKLNCIAKSPIPSEIGILLSWFSYTSLTAMMFGTINVLYRAYEKRYPSPSKGGTEQANINELMRLIVTENVMETSWKQISLVSIPLTIFTLSNLNYVQTFLHIADQAIALLPTWGLPFIYNWLNQQAGLISAGSNFTLNEWFGLFLLMGGITFYNHNFELARKYYPRAYSLSRLLKKAAYILALSAIASIAFVLLTYEDPSASTESRLSLIGTFIAAVVTYAAVLNIAGGKSLLSQMESLRSWLKSWPKPLTETYKALKKQPPHTHVINFFKELVYLLTSKTNYLYKNNLGLPKPTTEDHQLIPSNVQCLRKITLNDFKEEIYRRLRTYTLQRDSGTLLTTLSYLITGTKDALRRKQTKPNTKADIWRYGYVRATLLKILHTSTLVILFSILTPYFTALYLPLMKKIYKPIDLSRYSAVTHTITFLALSPFFTLAIQCGLEMTTAFFQCIEQKVQQVFNSVRGESKDDYANRFLPTTKKEAALFLFGASVYLLLAGIFAANSASAATVEYLLYVSNLWGPEFMIASALGTMMINTFGSANLLIWAKEKVTLLATHSPYKRDLYRKVGQFFAAVETLESSGAYDFGLDSMNQNIEMSANLPTANI